MLMMHHVPKPLHIFDRQVLETSVHAFDIALVI